MKDEQKLSKELIDFIFESPSQFHAAKNIIEKLKLAGFKELSLKEKWNIEKGGSYFVTKNDSAVIAFKCGNGEVEKEGFRIIGAHTDSPTFRIKPNPEMTLENTYIKLNTEVYGGPIINTWLDRPLSIAGRVTLKGKDTFNPETCLVNFKKPLLIIPNLAIHMNRKVNEGVELNRQKDTLPIIGLLNDELQKDNFLIKLISKEINKRAEDIIDFELCLYEYEKGVIMGADDEFVSSGRLDDLSMVVAGINAIINTNPKYGVNVMVCSDNEEVGSSTKQGADSPMLKNVLERIALAFGKSREDFLRALECSFMISADDAHAIHPNSPEKCDPVNKPKINGGPAIKISASQSYTTDSNSYAVYKEICNKAKVPCQIFVNRSDERGGSTIGPISSTHLNINSVDVGNAILAMHSVRELGGVKDQLFAQKSFEKFYEI